MTASRNLEGERLRRALLSGDEGALRELFQRYWPALFRQAKALLAPGLDPEDAAGEVWLRVLTNASSYRADGSVYAWLAQVCTRVCLDRARATQRHWVIFPLPHRVWETPGEPVPDETAETSAQRLHVALHRAVQSLPEREREAILLRFFFEASLAEVAALLQVAVETAKQATVRGLRRLRSSQEAPALLALLAARGGGS